MSPILLALIAVMATSCIHVILRLSVTSGAKPYATLIFYNLGAFSVLLIYFGIPSLAGLTWSTATLLIAAALLWLLSGIWSMRAYETLDASSGEIFGSAYFIFSVLIGVFIFQEHFSTLTLLGLTLVIAGIAWESSRSKIRFSSGCCYKLASCAATVCAVSLNKYLTGVVPISWIVLSGLLIPGLIYLAMDWRAVAQIVPAIRDARGLLLIPILEGICYVAAIHAYANGSLSTISILFRTGVAFVLVIEVFLLRLQLDLARKITASALCVGGAVIACCG